VAAIVQAYQQQLDEGYLGMVSSSREEGGREGHSSVVGLGIKRKWTE